MLTDSDFTPHTAETSATRPGDRSWPLYVLAAVVAASGLLSCWVASESFRMAEMRERQWQRFHSEVIGQLQDLTRTAGLATSHELCPVRFRFRTASFSPAPKWISGTADLISLDHPPLPPRLQSPSELCDFGLVPPGRYRLDVEIGKYQLAREFNVFPGAPVDRVVQYPPQPPPIPADLEMHLSSGDACLSGMVIVNAVPIVVGDWTWNYRNPVVAVTDHRVSESEAARLIEQAPGLYELLEAGAIPVLDGVPFLDSEVASAYLISQRDDGGTVVDTIHFGNRGMVQETAFSSTTSVRERFNLERPLLRWDRHELQPLVTINIPPVGGYEFETTNMGLPREFSTLPAGRESLASLPAAAVHDVVELPGEPGQSITSQ